ncbi:hypothetical protein OS493_001317, partial [Desmophyllum pertusum]
CDPENEKAPLKKKCCCSSDRREQQNPIDGYQTRPCLWDVFSDNYHNREVTGTRSSREARLL